MITPVAVDPRVRCRVTVVGVWGEPDGSFPELTQTAWLGYDDAYPNEKKGTGGRTATELVRLYAQGGSIHAC